MEAGAAVASHDRAQRDVAVPLQGREQRASSELPGAHEGDSRRARSRVPALAEGEPSGRLGGPLRGIPEEHGDAAWRRGQRVVAGRRLVRRKLAGHEISDSQRPLGDELQNGLHVPTLGPAHIGQRVVDPPLFVGGVIAPRSRGARHHQVELLPVERLPEQVHADAPDDDHAATGPRHLEALVHRLAALRPGRQQDGVRADAGCVAEHGFHRIRLAGDDSALGAQALGEPDPVLHHVDPDHASPGGSQDLHREEADEAEPHHDDRLPELGAGPAHAVEGDGAERDERRVPELHGLRDLDDEIAGDHHVLGVIGVAGAAAGHPVAHGELGDSGAHFLDDSGERVAQGDRPLHLVADQPHGLRDAGPAQPVPHLADDLGLPADPIHEPLAGDVRALGP